MNGTNRRRRDRLTLMLLCLLLAACGGSDSEKLRAELATQGTIIAANSTSIGAQSAQIATLTAQTEAQATWISYALTRPPILVTPIPPGSTPTPYRPVTGSVEIAGGACCAGGRAGETVDVSVAFAAESLQAPVTEMRMRIGGAAFDEAALAQAAWEPFVPEKQVTLPVVLNWITHTISVQYRDAEGNLSRVVVDDIAVEGSP